MGQHNVTPVYSAGGNNSTPYLFITVIPITIGLFICKYVQYMSNRVLCQALSANPLSYEIKAP